MLVLTRKSRETVVIGEDIEVIVLEIHGDRVKLGFRGPAEVPIHRAEVHEKIVQGPQAQEHGEPALDHAECA